MNEFKIELQKYENSSACIGPNEAKVNLTIIEGNEMTQWNSIFIRDAFRDTGLTPSNVATASHSPDIIPFGTLAMENFQQELASAWEKDIGVDVVEGQPNYLYVRGINSPTAGGVVSGTYTLYYVSSGTILQPSTFTKIPAYDGTQVSVGPTAPRQIATPNQAFYWQNPVAPPPNAHYCLIAAFQNDSVPDPVPAENFTSVDAYIKWVTGNANVAWRNIRTVPNGTAASTTAINISNPDPNSQDYLFLAEYSNLPSNTTVTISCAATGPSPEIHTQVVSSSPDSGVTTPVISLPAEWGPTPLTVTLQAPAGQVLDGASVTVRQLLLEGNGRSESVQMMMRPLHEHSRHPIVNAQDINQQTPVVRCGEFST